MKFIDLDLNAKIQLRMAALQHAMKLMEENAHIEYQDDKSVVYVWSVEEVTANADKFVDYLLNGANEVEIQEKPVPYTPTPGTIPGTIIDV